MYTDNIFAIYKPKGPTSHDIVHSIRKITGVKKVGHAGTLDPLAVGVLVVGVGREATKQLGIVVKKEKEYIATIKLGEESITDDGEGLALPNPHRNGKGDTARYHAIPGEAEEKKTKHNTAHPPTQGDIEDILHEFIGEIMQMPPVYSAVKIRGKEAYKRARRGEVVRLALRRVLIKDIHIVKYRWPMLILKVVTGPGVYIRSLARDIGKKLKVGAYLADLERTRVGEFTLEKSLTLDQFKKIHDDK